MLEAGQNWELFGYDMRNVGRHWLAAWRDLLLAHDSPVRARLDEVVALRSEEEERCYQAGQPSAETNAACKAILLPSELVLARTLALPLAAEGSLEQVLALEVNANSPFAADDTGHGWRIVGRSDNQLRVVLVIVSLSTVMTYLGQRYDIHDPHTQEVWAESAGELVVINGFGEQEREQRYRQRLLRCVGMLAGAAVLVLAGFAAGAALKGAEASRVEALAETVRAEASSASRSRSSLSMANETIAAVNEVTAAYPNPHRELARLTRLLDDSAFVERFSMKGLEIDLRGRAADAAAIMQLLNDQPQYEQVTAPRAITRLGNTGLEQFHLTIRLRPGTGVSGSVNAGESS